MTQVTDGSGPTSTLPYGERSAMQQDQRDVAAAGQPPQAPQPQQGQQTAPQPQTAEPVAGGPVPPQAVQPPPVTQRLDPTSVFSPARVGPAASPDLAWRQWALRFASHPQAGTGLRTLAAAVAQQRGPLDMQQGNAPQR